jgi:hypothetical protein
MGGTARRGSGGLAQTPVRWNHLDGDNFALDLIVSALAHCQTSAHFGGECASKGSCPLDETV